jgi:hypothetical protein
MHGTYLNKCQLKTNETRNLNDGDVVIFGAEVKRGDETFPACAFQLSYNLTPFRYVRSVLGCRKTANFQIRIATSNTFTYPESSDIEDEEDYELSDGGFDEGEPTSSEDDLSVESPQLKMSQAIDPIDLTRDDYPAVFSIIDGPNDSNPISVPGLDGPTTTDHYPNATYPSNSPICEEGDEEKVGFSSESDDRSESAGSDGRRFHSPSYSSEVEDSEDEGCIKVGHLQSRTGSIQSNRRCSIHSSTCSSIDNARLGISSVKNSTSIEKHEQTTDYGDSGEGYDEEYESDFGLSQAGRDGLNKLRADGLLENVVDSPFSRGSKDIVEAGSSIPRAFTARSDAAKQNDSSFSGLCWDSMPAMVSTPSQNQTIGSPLIVQAAAVEYLSDSPLNTNPRQPSPSDAAMVKTAIAPCDASIVGSRLSTGKWEEPAIQALGDKTGKHGFFEARMFNKSTLRAIPTEEVESSSVSNSLQHIVPKGTLEELQLSKNAQDSVSKLVFEPQIVMRNDLSANEDSRPNSLSKSISMITNQSTDVTVVIPNTSQLPFLYDPTQVPSLHASPSPEPDMTSSVRYNESKAWKIAATTEAGALVSGRSGLSINDIIDDDSSSQPITTLKRKADNISDDIENEVRNWASILPSDISEGSTNTSTSQPGDSLQLGNACPNTILLTPDQRPAKKARKFIERLGYAAIGGAAVGATLFSVLVATAPDFM